MRKQDYENETNSTVIKKVEKQRLNCPYCPPNKFENKKRGKPSRSWKDKTKRKHQHK